MLAAEAFRLPSDAPLPLCIKNTFIDVDDEVCQNAVRRASRARTLPPTLCGDVAIPSDASTADEGEDYSLPTSSLQGSPRSCASPFEASLSHDSPHGQLPACHFYPANYVFVPCWGFAASSSTAAIESYFPWASDAHCAGMSARAVAPPSCAVTSLTSELRQPQAQKYEQSEMEKLPELNCSSKCDRLLDSVREAVLGNGNVVVGTERFSEADSYTVIIRMRKEKIRYKSAVLNSAQKALLDAAKSDGVCVRGCCESQFESTKYGFATRLEILASGAGTCCSHQEVSVNFVVWKVD